MKYSSRKKFTGSMPESFYSKDYFLNAKGSMYGRKIGDRYQFYPYTEEYQLPGDREFAKSVKVNLNTTSVMVLGCARGYMVRAFREINVDAVGVDISKWVIENCDPTVVDYVYNGDVCDLSLWDDKSFDLVLAIDVLEHIRVPDLYTAIDECTRVGKLVFLGCPIAKNDDNPDQSDPNEEGSHVSIYSLKWWVNQFYARGFVPIEIKFFNKDNNINTLFADVGSTDKYLVVRNNGRYELVKR